MKPAHLALIALVGIAGPLAAQDNFLRDPTRPLGWQEVPDKALPKDGGPRLELIWRKGEKQFATISGTQFAVGEEIEGIRLIKIGENEVTVETAQGRQTLRLTPAAERSAQTGETK
ncbi:MAG: hypothetical protein LBP58_04075 [Azoarcus sp.]|jgi:hypothetical protein|nr:hypothetical protein [Azoarcus sp.]